MSVNVQHVVLFHHFRRFLEAAAREGLDAVPLKGAALVAWDYPPEEDRGLMSDVDFLVREEHFERAAEILAELGFRPKVDREHFRLTQHAAFRLDVDEGRSIMFELHRAIFNPARVQTIRHRDLWARTRPAAFEGQPCRRLAPEDMFVHVAFHAVIHRLMQLRRTVRDLELIAQEERPDPQLVIERAEQWRVTRAVWLLCDLLVERNADAGLDRIRTALAPPLSVQMALRALVPDTQRTRLTGLHHRVQAALLWPLVFDSLPLLAHLVLTHTHILRMAQALGLWRARAVD